MAEGISNVLGVSSKKVNGSHILKHGFFNIDKEFVQVFLDNPYFAWGGLYAREHDWMHFEIRANARYGQTKTRKSLHDEFNNLDELLNAINALGDTKYKWHDAQKKDYIIKQ